MECQPSCRCSGGTAWSDPAKSLRSNAAAHHTDRLRKRRLCFFDVGNGKKGGILLHQHRLLMFLPTVSVFQCFRSWWDITLSSEAGNTNVLQERRCANAWQCCPRWVCQTIGSGDCCEITTTEVTAEGSWKKTWHARKLSVALQKHNKEALLSWE